MGERDNTYRSSPIGSEGWLLEQQMRAEWEAQEWRRIRADFTKPEPASTTTKPVARPWYEGGSIILKGLVRFALGAFGGYLGYIVAANGEAGDIEIWMAIGLGFVTMLALSAVGPAREFVALLAELLRWVLIIAVIVGGAWLFMKSRGA